MNALTAQQYTDRSYVFRGDTKPYAELMKYFGARWNTSLKDGGPPGWIMPISRYQQFKDHAEKEKIYYTLLPARDLSALSQPSLVAQYPPSPTRYIPVTPTYHSLPPSLPPPSIVAQSPTYRSVSSFPLSAYPYPSPIVAATPIPLPAREVPKYQVKDVEDMTRFDLIYYLVDKDNVVKGDEALDMLRCLVLMEMSQHKGNIDPRLARLVRQERFKVVCALSDVELCLTMKKLKVTHVGLHFSRLIATIVVAAYKEGEGALSSVYREMLINLDDRLATALPQEDQYPDEEQEVKV